MSELFDSSDPCLIHVLTKEQIDILLKNVNVENSYKISWRRKYCTLLKYYLKVCYVCQNTTFGNKEQEQDFLDNLEIFIEFLYGNISIFNESNEMKNAITLMLCHHPRCNNHTSWDKKLDRSFMNWISHRVCEMGNYRLGITNKECMKLGARTPEQILLNVKNCIEPIISTKINDINFLENITFAQRCYYIDYQTRDLRHGKHSICGQSNDSKHDFRKELANSLQLILADWVIEEENSSNKRQRNFY